MSISKITQKEQVIEVMRKNGGYATFELLNRMVDFSTWKTKTPQASVRGIVQVYNEFFRIQPGLWALEESKKDVLEKFNIGEDDKNKQEKFTHTYYQGLLVETGNILDYCTYIPNQDKNRLFLEKPLGEISTIKNIYEFSYPEIVNRAKTIDTIWFNERKLPSSFFEVEHSTDIKNSLIKYYELQDFSAKFYIVAPKHRKRQFDDVINRSIFKDIRHRIGFLAYEDVATKYEKESLRGMFK